MVPTIVVDPNLESRLIQINQLLSEHQLKKDHPNILWLEDEKVGITEARKVIQHLALRPYQGVSQGVVIVQADNLTEEAQNALLKTLEEPPLQAVIILGASTEDNFLPTVLSRCQIISSKLKVQSAKLEDKDREKIEWLIQSSIEQRFQFIEKLTEREQFLEKLTIYFRDQLLTKSENTEFIQHLLTAQKWAKQNVNIRAILEYLMLRLP